MSFFHHFHYFMETGFELSLIVFVILVAVTSFEYLFKPLSFLIFQNWVFHVSYFLLPFNLHHGCLRLELFSPHVGNRFEQFDFIWLRLVIFYPINIFILVKILMNETGEDMLGNCWSKVILVFNEIWERSISFNQINTCVDTNNHIHIIFILYIHWRTTLPLRTFRGIGKKPKSIFSFSFLSFSFSFFSFQFFEIFNGTFNPKMVVDAWTH